MVVFEDEKRRLGCFVVPLVDREAVAPRVVVELEARLLRVHNPTTRIVLPELKELTGIEPPQLMPDIGDNKPNPL